MSFMAVRRISLMTKKRGDAVEAQRPGTPGGLHQTDLEAIDAQSELFKIYTIYQRIRSGAFSYIKTQYIFFVPFMLVVASLLLLLIGFESKFFVFRIGKNRFKYKNSLDSVR